MLRRHSLVTLLLAFVGAPPAASAALAPSDWDAAVTAAEAVDPLIGTSSLDQQAVQVVGGGKRLLIGFPAFAVSAKQDLTGARGEMTLILGSGNTVRADVVCVAAVVLQDGGGFARINGAVREPGSGSPTLTFFVTDSGQPGGAGDAWDTQFFMTPPEDQPCVASPGVDPIAAGNVAVSAIP